MLDCMHQLIHVVSCNHTQCSHGKHLHYAFNVPSALGQLHTLRALTPQTGMTHKVCEAETCQSCIQGSRDGQQRRHTYILLACTLVGYLGADYAHKHPHLVAALVDLVGCPVDSFQCCLGDDV